MFSQSIPSATSFPVTTLSPFIVIFDGVFVWPGDTNNDGFVDIADVLPVGAWFGSIGPERPFFDFGWFPQAAFNWDIETLAYVDATGDGTINQNDILPIGLNFGLSVDDFFFKESQETDPVQYLVIPAGFPAGTISDNDCHKRANGSRWNHRCCGRFCL